MAGAYQSEASCDNDIDRSFTLPWYGINYDRKTFYETTPGAYPVRKLCYKKLYRVGVGNMYKHSSLHWYIIIYDNNRFYD